MTKNRKRGSETSMTLSTIEASSRRKERRRPCGSIQRTKPVVSTPRPFSSNKHTNTACKNNHPAVLTEITRPSSREKRIDRLSKRRQERICGGRNEKNTRSSSTRNRMRTPKRHTRTRKRKLCEQNRHQ